MASKGPKVKGKRFAPGYVREAAEYEVMHPALPTNPPFLHGRALLGTGGQVSVETKAAQPGTAAGSVVLNVQEVAGGVWHQLPLTAQQADKLSRALRDAAVDVILAAH